MRLCAIQQPYSYKPEDAPSSVDFLIEELNSCDPSLDLIVTPEYSNCPSAFPVGESLPFAVAPIRKSWSMPPLPLQNAVMPWWP